MKQIITLLLLACFSFSIQIKAQSLYKVTLEEKVANSTLIVEGKVVEQRCFWNAAHTFIFTANKIQVYKVFKGNETPQFIEVVTQGGTIDNKSIEASDLLALEKDKIGVFFCYPNTLNLRSPFSNNLLMDIYSSSQGCFVYETFQQKAVAPFVFYNSITQELYPELQTKIGTQYKVVDGSFNLANRQTMIARTNAPSVTAMSPLTVNAGATLSPSTNVLTLTGSGFGTATSASKVSFADGNTGGSTPTFDVLGTSPLIVSWTDTEIKLRVPSRAASGFVKVTDNLGSETYAPDNLTVFYGILTSQLTVDGVTIIKESNLMNQNGSGGYNILYSISTAGSGVNLDAAPEKATFQRALNTWKEVTGANYVEAGTTGIQSVSNDYNNVIMFDNTNTGVSVLASGVLAVCYSYNSTCSPSTNEIQKTGFDIVLRNTGVSSGSVTFTAGPCPPSTSGSVYDFETVILHELGHSLNLAHVNEATQGSYPNLNPAKLMHYAVTNGVKRVTPDASAYKGVLYQVVPQGNTYGSCGLFATEMTQLSYTAVTNDNCPTSFPVTATQIGTTVPFDLVHATSDKNVDPAYNNITCNSTGVGITNNQYYALKTGGTAGDLTITVLGYTTSPTTQAACTTAGIELALYAVSSCPTTPSAYPTPVACRSFNADGALTTITGLSAATNYLLMVDGLANTKATFNLTFTGTTGLLPIKFTSFTGEVMNNYNALKWTAELVQNVNKIIVERSFNGAQFENIGEINGNAVYNKNNNYNDYKAVIGNNYYRLKIVNSDGSSEYSNTIVLKRNDKFLFTISPNPAVSFVDIQMSAEVKSNYNVMVYNMTGQSILSKTITVNGNRTNTRLDVSNFAKGIYNVVVYDENKIKLKAVSLSIQ